MLQGCLRLELLLFESNIYPLGNRVRGYFIFFRQRASGRVRVLVNEEEVIMAIRKAGYEGVQLIDFAEYPFIEQLQIAYCTDILIGAEGAGMMW